MAAVTGIWRGRNRASNEAMASQREKAESEAARKKARERYQGGDD